MEHLLGPSRLHHLRLSEFQWWFICVNIFNLHSERPASIFYFLPSSFSFSFFRRLYDTLTAIFFPFSTLFALLYIYARKRRFHDFSGEQQRVCPSGPMFVKSVAFLYPWFLLSIVQPFFPSVLHPPSFISFRLSMFLRIMVFNVR